MRRAFAAFAMYVPRIVLALVTCAWAQAAPVAFCGIVSRDAEGSMVKMTEDLYYTQLLGIDGVEVVDRRKSGFARAYLDDGEPNFSLVEESRIFYALINREGDDKWNCSLCLADADGGAGAEVKVRRVDKTYGSYYKILMENKDALQTSFKALLNGGEIVASDGTSPPSGEGTGISSPIGGTGAGSTSGTVMNTDALAGTWIGEDGVEKAVILRGGRGFIIFRNGATMNIKVENENDNVVITQAGRSNASFFPELPRDVALNAAGHAEPIVWYLAFDGDSMLRGEKRTLVPEGKGAGPGYVAVTWRRKA